MIIFFMLMQFRRTYEFKTQNRWLKAHPEMMLLLNIETVPHRTTLSHQYKKLSEVIAEFVAFVGAQVAGLDESFANTNLAEDKSLFKASGPVWHQSDRNEGRIPKKQRRLDTDATWSKSGYQAWVYGVSRGQLGRSPGYGRQCARMGGRLVRLLPFRGTSESHRAGRGFELGAPWRLLVGHAR